METYRSRNDRFGRQLESLERADRNTNRIVGEVFTREHHEALEARGRLEGTVRDWWQAQLADPYYDLSPDLPGSGQWTPEQTQQFSDGVLDFGDQSEQLQQHTRDRMAQIAAAVPIDKVQSFLPDGQRHAWPAGAAEERQRLRELLDRLPSIRPDGRIPEGVDGVFDATYTNRDGTLARGRVVMIGDSADATLPTTWYTPYALAGRLQGLHDQHNVRALMLTGLQPSHQTRLEVLAARGDQQELRQFLQEQYKPPAVDSTDSIPGKPGREYYDGLAQLIDQARTNGVHIAAIGGGGQVFGGERDNLVANFQRAMSSVPPESNFVVLGEFRGTDSASIRPSAVLGIDTTIDAYHPGVSGHYAPSTVTADGSRGPLDIHPDDVVVNWFKQIDQSTAIWNTYPTTN